MTIINDIKKAIQNGKLINRKTKDEKHLLFIDPKTREFFLVDLEKVNTGSFSYEELKKHSKQWENMNEDGSMGSCTLPNQREKEILILQINLLLKNMSEQERGASLDYIKKTIPCRHCIQQMLDKWKIRGRLSVINSLSLSNKKEKLF